MKPNKKAKSLGETKPVGPRPGARKVKDKKIVKKKK